MGYMGGIQIIYGLYRGYIVVASGSRFMALRFRGSGAQGLGLGVEG